MDQPLLSLDHVTLRYEHGIQALDDVSLNIAAGERICVLGPNGSGKSTLASILCGLLAPDEGTVELLGERVFGEQGIDFEAYRRVRRSLGLVFQNPDDQIVTSVVEEDIAFGPENLGVASDEIGVRVARELHRVALDRYAKADPNNLSGGQKQRAAIAGALAMEPQVLVLDEPGALLDVRGRRGIMRVMDQLHEAGTTIVHVTHFMEEALAADRVVVLAKGRLVLEGKPAEVFSHGDELTELGLEEPFCARLAEALRAKGVGIPWTCDEKELLASLSLAPASGTPSEDLARQGRLLDDARQLRMRSLRSLGSSLPPDTVEQSASRGSSEGVPAAGVSESAIQSTGLTYSYGDTDAREARHPALDEVSFAIPRGSFTTIVGQTGSGKSTLVRLLCALETPDAGRLVVEGIDTSDRRRRRQLHGRIGYVMQHPERQLFAETVLEDVAYGPTNLRLPADEIERRCASALAQVGLTGREQASPFHLSGGQQRLCALAGILAMEPDVLVLDEPMAGLDPHGRTQLRDIIARINAQGTTVVQVTHSMNDAAISQQVIVLNEGKLLMQGAPGEVFSADARDALRASGLGLPDALTWALRLEEGGLAGLGSPLTLGALVDALTAGASPAPEPEEVSARGL